jgi:hypothetical protein
MNHLLFLAAFVAFDVLLVALLFMARRFADEPEANDANLPAARCTPITAGLWENEFKRAP